MERLRTFASMSHQWLLLVNETRSFWRAVSSNMPLPLLQTILSRSANHSLDVIYSKKRRDSTHRRRFTTLVVEHVHRWRSLTIWNNPRDAEDVNTVQSLVHLSAPALEVLTCRGRQEAVDLFSGEAHRLRRLKLQQFCIPWESKMLSGLEILDLKNIGTNLPSVVQLLATLAASPGLVELRLNSSDHY
ncbi:hypothetical protein FRB94_002268 [Tulasnella sp. JGI-2019a]|nr:hypothetical protein FRB94_002268 [Tulasnella sp. JGI-2019a]